MTLIEQFDEMHKVGKLTLTGHEPKEISALLSIPHAQVLMYQREWRKWVHEVSGKVGVRERLLEVITEADQHWNMVHREAWAVNEAAKLDEDRAIQIQALKLVAQINKDRANLHAQITSDSDAELADQLAELEENYEQLKNLLRAVTKDCERCRIETRRQMAEITGEAEVIEVQESDD